jgi:hypothetical protein
MSAAAARRRKQLAARQTEGDAVATKLQTLLDQSDEEATAYEALQLAQSVVRKNVHAGNFKEATEVAYSASLALLEKNRISVVSQLLQGLAEVLKETHTEVTDEWIDRIILIHETHQKAMATKEQGTAETNRLLRLQREFLRKCASWSADLGAIRFGNPKLLELLGDQTWRVPAKPDAVAEEGEDRVSIMADAVQAMCLAEKPEKIAAWLKELPPPTEDQTKHGHVAPPADRDALLTRAILVFCAVENLRDANILLRMFIDDIEDRPMDDLLASYMKKDDGKSPSHVIFCCMLLRVCEKDQRTGPLYTWLIRSFKRELDLMTKPQLVQSYCTKIGKVYFNIQPPPSMISMMENMMGMMGGGAGGINPAMMQAALAQAQGMK